MHRVGVCVQHSKAQRAASADADVAAEQYRREIERLNEEAAQVGFCFGADAFRVERVSTIPKAELTLDSPPLASPGTSTARKACRS